MLKVKIGKITSIKQFIQSWIGMATGLFKAAPNSEGMVKASYAIIEGI